MLVPVSMCNRQCNCFAIRKNPAVPAVSVMKARKETERHLAKLLEQLDIYKHDHCSVMHQALF